MRLSETKIDYLCRKIYAALRESKNCVLIRAEAPAVETMKNVFLDDLRAEEELDAEVEAILEEHREEMRRRGADYHTMFKKTKAHLARERKMTL